MSRYDLTDFEWRVIGEGSQPGSCGRFSPQSSAAQSAGLKPQTPRAKQMAALCRDH
jgi:hypothetical protein